MYLAISGRHPQNKVSLEVSLEASLELSVVGVDLLHHSQALLQNLLLQTIFLVLVQIGILPHHIICALQYHPNIARTTHPILHHHSATVEPPKSMPISDSAHCHWAIRVIDPPGNIEA